MAEGFQLAEDQIRFQARQQQVHVVSKVFREARI
jgi:hypothetical protein